ncbi:MAG: hypothetical protein AAFY11_08750 [Cyanobacteria bacterium J06641_5]
MSIFCAVRICSGGKTHQSLQATGDRQTPARKFCDRPRFSKPFLAGKLTCKLQ